MSRISPSAFGEVKHALETYKQAVESTDLASETQETYIDRADKFVRWLDGRFEPGEKKKRLRHVSDS